MHSQYSRLSQSGTPSSKSSADRLRRMSDKFPQPLSGLRDAALRRGRDVHAAADRARSRKARHRAVGVPWDGGTTNRPGARHGPREIRNMSTLMRRVHHVSLVAPYELCRVGDHGDAPVNPIDLADSLEAHRGLLRARCTRPARRRSRPAATIWSPCRSCARSPASGRSESCISTPIPTPTTAISAARNTRTARRSAAPIEEGLIDPKRMIQIGIRGSMYSADEKDWAESVGIRIVHIEEFFRLGPDAGRSPRRAASSATARSMSASTSTGSTRSMRPAPARPRSAASRRPRRSA